MKQLSVRITSIILATLVVLSTLSFTVEKHFCGEFLMDVSFTGNADDCGMEMEKSSKKNCCKDELETIEGKDNLQQHTVKEFSFSNTLFVASFVISYQDLFKGISSDKPLYKDLYPPDIPKDFQVFYQSFLI